MIQTWLTNLSSYSLFIALPILIYFIQWFSGKRNEIGNLTATVITARRNITEKHIRPALIQLSEELNESGYLNPEEAAEDLFPEEEDMDAVGKQTEKLSKFFDSRRSLSNKLNFLRILIKIGFWQSGITFLIFLSFSFPKNIWGKAYNTFFIITVVSIILIIVLWLICMELSHIINEKASKWF